MGKKRLFRIRRQSSSRVSTTEDPSESSETSCDASQQHPKKQYPMEILPGLVQELQNFRNQTEDKNMKLLRKLFVLSEHDCYHDDRVEMARHEDGALIAGLLAFLQESTLNVSSVTKSLQNIALLVLNNLSIPVENKKIIAVDCEGGLVLVKLLDNDPSCHLVTIILVNLVYSDVETRSKLVDPSTGLIDSIALALLIASMTRTEHTAYQSILASLEQPCSTLDRLEALVHEFCRADASTLRAPLPSAETQLYPETARWALAALKNLTRPSISSGLAEAVIRTGIVKHLVRVIALPASIKAQSVSSREDSISTAQSHDDTPIPAEPFETMIRLPDTWKSNTPADSALSVVMNLAMVPACRPVLLEADAVHALCGILECTNTTEMLQCATTRLQRIKARQTLAFLLCSSGHFGQNRPKVKLNPVHLADGAGALIVSEHEARELVALLANLLHHREHDAGPGGYAASSFTTRGVLLAIRCFLTRFTNVVTFAEVGGPALNALLLRIVSLVVVEQVSYLDMRVAGQAVFCLYLLSDFGFSNVFLPDSFGGADGFTAKLLTAFWLTPDVSPSINHAVCQLIKRLPHLCFDLYEDECVKLGVVRKSDIGADGHVLSLLDTIKPETGLPGAKPRPHLLDRAIVRTPVVKSGQNVGRSPWDGASLEAFASALEAAKEFSYGSIKVRHLEDIDDVRIANNIAKSADGEKTESYNYLWSWEDAALEIQRRLDTTESSLPAWAEGENMVALGLLTQMCLADNTDAAAVDGTTE